MLKQLLSILIVLTLSALIYIYVDNEVEEMTSPVDDVSSYMKEEFEGLEYILTHSSNTYARAVVEGRDVFLTKLSSEWQVVVSTTDPVFCERMERLGFPNNFISDCVLEYSNSVSDTELVEKINNNEIEEGDSYTIIINIPNIQEEDCNCLSFEVDDEVVSIAYDDELTSEDVLGVDVGDTVAIEVETDDGEVVISSIEEVDDEEIDIDFDYLDNEPDESPLSYDDYLKGLIDIDNSDIDVQIIGN